MKIICWSCKEPWKKNENGSWEKICECEINTIFILDDREKE